MRKIHVDDIVATLRQLCIDANIEIRPDTVEAYHRALEQEESETGREVKRSGNLVHVWSHYASAVEQGGEPYTRGVNTITLFHDGDRWWIMGWMFDGSAG